MFRNPLIEILMGKQSKIMHLKTMPTHLPTGRVDNIRTNEGRTQPVKLNSNKQLDPKQELFRPSIVMPKGSKKILLHGKRNYQLTSAGRSANHGQIDHHWLAGNSYFPCGRIFISSFSEPLGINIEGLKSLLLWKELFI